MSSEPHRRTLAPRLAVLSAALVVGLTGCDDDPFAFNWSDAPDTVLLYSLARPELNLVSAYNFFQGVPVQLEAPSATGQWDMAVDTRDGRIVLLTPTFFGISSAARIATLEGLGLDDVRQAPGDTLLYVADEPVIVDVGNVYVIKTNRQRGSFGRRCVYFAKMEALNIDPGAGTLTFREVSSPICNSRDLTPPD